MSLNDSRMLPTRIRNMRQMNDVLNAEDIILAEIERMIDEMYQRASLLHEELVNEAWLESKLSARTGAIVDIVEYGEQLLVDFVLDVSAVIHIDMKDVRTFIEKWLPAHLMYKIILMLAYSVNAGEKFTTTEMAVSMDLPFWNVRRLNGAWLLNGTYNLGSGRKGDEWGISYDIGNTEIQEKMGWRVNVAVAIQLQECLSDAGIVIGFDLPFWNVRMLNGTWLLDGCYELDVLRKPDTFGMVIDVGNADVEETISGYVVIKKDLWLLDGSYWLSGTKVLDAVRREEEL